jgi:hypothetical protein
VVIRLYIVAGMLVYLGINSLVPHLVRQYSELMQPLPEFAERTQRWLEEHGTIVLGGNCKGTPHAGYAYNRASRNAVRTY